MTSSASLSREVERVLDSVRPAIRAHAGDVHVLSIDAAGSVDIGFSGACKRCPIQPVTFNSAVVPRLREIPGVNEVSCSSVRISAVAQKRIQAIFGNIEEQI